MRIVRALRANRKDRLALVGAGGKTTALFRLARELPPPVIVTATTHLSHSQLTMADRYFLVRNVEDIQRASMNLDQGVYLFTGKMGEDGRTEGLVGEPLEALRHLADELDCPLLIEADGSRQKPLKAPAEHEPAIPAWVNRVVVVAGMNGLNQPLTQDWVHRPEVFARLSGLEAGERVTPQALIRVLSHPEGGLKNIPPGASRSVLLNQANTQGREVLAEEIAKHLLDAYASILLGSLREESEIQTVREKTATVILAAGGSKRLNRPKQLLEWQGRPLVRHVAEIAIAAGLSPVVVVTGSESQAVMKALEGLPVVEVNNPAWDAGQSGSVKAGVGKLSGDVGSAIFLVVDQPYLDEALVRTLVNAHSHSLAPLVAPLVNGQRTNPVLFDREVFSDLLDLDGDVGGRAIFGRYPLEFVLWDDPRLAIDIDTPEDYERLIAQH